MTVNLLTELQQDYFDQLWTQLKHEDDTGQVGFYCNRNLIAKGFENGDLYCLVDDDTVVGFSLCSTFEQTGRLEIVEVLAKYRMCGYGRVLVELSLAELRANGILVIEIECVPSESESFWRHMGFIDLTPGADPNDRYRGPNSFCTTKLYTRLVNHALANVDANLSPDTLSVELWQGEPWETKELLPNWHWIVPLDKAGQLQRPIIHSANKDWRLRICLNRQVLHDDKLKRVSNEHSRWGYNLILKSLASITR